MPRHPRVLYLAASLVLLHVAAAAILGTQVRLAVPIIELAAAVSSAWACFAAGGRSRYLARAFWFLAGCSFALWSAGRVIEILGTILRHGSGNVSTSPLLLLIFFLAFLPMLFAVFVFEYRADEPLRVELIPDALQVITLVIAAYAFFVLIPTATEGAESTNQLRLLVLHSRNVLIAGGLICRGAFTRSASTRRLFAPMAAVMSLFAVSAWLGHQVAELTAAPSAPTWFGLGWTLPFALVVLVATRWTEPEDAAQSSDAGQRISTILLVYAPSLLIPVVLFVKVHTIKRSQIFLALATLLLSLVLYTIKLALLQARQNKILKSLKHSESQYRSLFERNMAGVFRASLDGKLLDFNPAFAQMFGYTRAEMLGMSTHRLYPEGEAQRGKIFEALRDRSFLERLESEYVRKDGSRMLAIGNGQLVADEEGHVVIEGTVLDVTDRHVLELQLRQAQKLEAVGRLAGGVAHDFNNLLTIVTGYSELQLQATDPGTPVHEHAERIREAGRRAADLTRQLLAFSRRQVLQPQNLNLNTVVMNLRKLLLRVIGENIQVSTTLQPDLGTVKVDPGQIEQVILNLALNARDAMPNGGKLTLQTSNLELTEGYVSNHRGVARGHYVQFVVSDTGVGMDPKTLSHIFEPFFTTKELGKGTGLGLATVYGIIQQSGGHIWAYSEVGIGSTFKILLPRVDEEPTPIAVELSEPAENRGSETILVVEDDPALRQLTASILTACGYNVLAAEKPNEVDEACARQDLEIDLLLTDMVMPVMSGREIAERVAMRCPKVKVLYMSGYTSDAIVNDGVLERGTAFLQKPFTPTSLSAKVREVLDTDPLTVTH